MQPLGVAISTLALAGLLITGGGLPFLATTTAPVSAPAPADTGATGGAAVREAPTEPAADTSDGSEFTTRAASEPPVVTGPAAAMPAPTGATPVSGAPQAPAASPEVETMMSSELPAASTDSEGTSANSAPAPSDASAPSEAPAPAPASAEDRDAGGDAASATPVTAADPATSAGWVVLLVAGLALIVIRPIARRLSR